jgi:2-polyprenyl-6-methoxyphenol hydroxylase-like FAD-dependent oxidoreductase
VATADPKAEPVPAETVADVQQTTCCIVGAGPAGLVLAFLLARQGVPVVLLESHKDFDRDFRGDTIHPSTLEILDQVGLADRLLQIPHGKVRQFRVITPQNAVTLADLSRLKTKFPYVALLPQERFLEFLSAEAAPLPSFRLVFGANVQRLVEENGAIRGVRYRGSDDAWHEVRAELTVAADGRFSKIRSLAGIEPQKTTPPMDVLWFRLPRKDSDPRDVGAIYIHAGHFAVMLERPTEWQVGYAIVKGDFQQVRKEGIEAVRRSLAETVPWIADRVGELHDWHQVSVLSVESSRMSQWYTPGLLLIGDAAHVMSPVGGVGINVAIQDAVQASNLLGDKLKKGTVQTGDLAEVQKSREFSVKLVQRFQGFMQQNIAKRALEKGQPFRLPLPVRILARLPIIRDLPARLIAFGIPRVRLREQ